MAVIEVDALVKEYDGTRAVDGVGFGLDEGEVFALLGPNGAGKSTTIEILEGHRRRTSGRVSVLGLDPEVASRELRDRIGIVLQSTGIDAGLTVREAIETYGSVYRRPRALDEILAMVGLEEKVDARVKTLSGGQQRRIDLALGIVGSPEVLFLDEPTTGFDPSARRRSWDLVSGLRGLGTTILLTTHYMDEAQHLADRVGVIVGGRIVASGTPASLVDALGGTRITCRVPEGVTPPAGLTGRTGTLSVSGSRIEVVTDDPTSVLHRLTGWALETHTELADLTVDRPSLEDVYLRFADADDGDGPLRPDGAAPSRALGEGAP